MNPRRNYPQCLLIAVMASAFIISSQTPLCAAQQAAESSTKSIQLADDALPDAPQPQSAQQESTQAPSGAAGAKAAPVKGAPVGQPVGAAVAPARQRSHRSLLIKVGLIAGAAVAVGAVVALSERSPTRPPGASLSTHP